MKLKAMALAVLAWVWDYIVSWWNYVVDPPARHLKVYFWVVVGVSLAGYFVWAPVVGAVKWVFSPVMQAAAPLKRQPMYLLPPGVIITTTRPPRPADVTTLPEKVTTPAAKAPNTGTVAAKKVTTPRRRVTKREAWNPFAN